MIVGVFDWDQNNLTKIRALWVKVDEVEQALSRDPVLIYEQDAGGDSRYVYYGETERGRVLAIVLTERNDKIRVITAYDLDAGRSRTTCSGASEGSDA